MTRYAWVVIGGCMAGLLAACSTPQTVQPFSDSAHSLQSYDFSRLTPFPRQTPRAEYGAPYELRVDEMESVLVGVSPQLSDPASARLVRLQARQRVQGAVEMCGLAQSANQTGGDARMMLFAGYLTHGADGTAHFSPLTDADMIGKMEFCRSRGLT
ncbi:hypothetical protein FPY71_01310 [Aureimonas fodinaquatilis]|uniref:Lipoprotein n=1 Tax=Aureimonas fodinaquatilis TaxID=2565783 RepID=A0A5B0DZJ7_9HYPH|nr:hypothetical protein [Aureimonas fodinaquatilis]KAA0971798.1 hypothetical protein FPY71_01310 [Aureimonas fodinaquatilis]